MELSKRRCGKACVIQTVQSFRGKAVLNHIVGGMRDSGRRFCPEVTYKARYIIKKKSIDISFSLTDGK